MIVVRSPIRAMSRKTSEDDRGPGSFYRRSLASIFVVAAMSFFIFLLRPLKSPVTGGESADASVVASTFRYHCDQASDDAREAINYYADPCEDFHAFACSAARGRSGYSQLVDETRTLQQVLVELSFRNESDDVAVQAGRFFKACLMMPSSLQSLLEQNFIVFLRNTNFTKSTLLSSVKTPRDMVNLSALLSYKHGFRPFTFFETSHNKTLAMHFSRPFHTTLNETMVKFVFTVVKELMGAGKLTLKSIDNVVAADRELEKLSAHLSTSSISLDTLASASREGVNTIEWQSIIETYTPRSVRWSDIRTTEADILREVFNVFFGRLKPEEAVLYSVAHALLPTQMVEAFQRNHDSSVCLKLVKDTFAPVWDDLEPYLLGFFDESQEAESIAASVTGVLKRVLTRKSSPADSDQSHAIIAKLEKLSLDIPSTEDFVNLGQRMPKLGNLSDHSLYENIIQCQRAASQSKATKQNETSERSGRARFARATVTLPTTSFKPSSYCHGHLNLLNYATLGVDIADALLWHIGAAVPGVARTSSIFKPLSGNLSACLGKEAKNSSTGPQGSGVSLEQVALSLVAFQVALEASKVQALPHLQNAWDEPAWRQTFFVKYCQTLCAKSATRSGSDSFDAALVCNLVVMNSPEFTRLFRCEIGEPMVPSQYCSAL